MESCRVCESTQLKLVKPSNLDAGLTSSDFAITDAGYGKTLAIFRCGQCGFMQCHGVDNVVEFYERLSDEAYEEGRDQRTLQALALIKVCLSNLTSKHQTTRLLDIGAGSGILVEAATRLGISAQGVEPSAWLVSAAAKHKCEVYQGVLPHPLIGGPFDIITIVDVIEHVPDPAALLREARNLLADDGVLLVVTPDASSIAARVMGWRWWHYRIAHIGYFNRNNFGQLCERTSLIIRHSERPGWYFTVSYLRERLLQYLPRWMLPKMKWMDKSVVPLNLYDSLLFVCSRNRSST